MKTDCEPTAAAPLADGGADATGTPPAELLKAGASSGSASALPQGPAPRDEYQADGVITDLANAAARYESNPDHEPSRRDMERARALLRAGFANLSAALSRAERERDEAKAAFRERWCEKCRQRYCGGPDEGTSRATCPKCGTWMLHFWEYAKAAAESTAQRERERAEALETALRELATAADQVWIRLERDWHWTKALWGPLDKALVLLRAFEGTTR